MLVLPGDEVVIGMEYDKQKGLVTLRFDGHPEVVITVGDLNRLLSQTCVFVTGTRCKKG